MAPIRELLSIIETLKRHLLWQYLRLLARKANIDPVELARVGNYLDSKFGLREFQSCNASQTTSGYFPGLNLTTVYSPHQFAWVRRLEQNAHDIRNEFLSLRDRGAFKPHPQKLANAGDWNTYYLYSNGRRYEEHCAACLITAGTIAELPGVQIAGPGEQC